LKIVSEKLAKSARNWRKLQLCETESRISHFEFGEHFPETWGLGERCFRDILEISGCESGFPKMYAIVSSYNWSYNDF
jgi:hypothetical protein